MLLFDWKKEIKEKIPSEVAFCHPLLSKFVTTTPLSVSDFHWIAGDGLSVRFIEIWGEKKKKKKSVKVMKVTKDDASQSLSDFFLFQ